MMLSVGGNASVPIGELVVRVFSGNEADITAFRLQSNGKVADDAEMIFYGHKQSSDGAVTLTSEGTNSAYLVNLNKINQNVEKIAFSCTCNPGQTITSLRALSIQIECGGEVLLQGTVDLQSRTEAALILGELYRRNNEWKFRFVSQGFNGGLKPLAEFYGVDIKDDESEVKHNSPAKIAATPAPQATVNLSKISLTKNNPTVSLTKRRDYGLIKVNLNWNRATKKSAGLFSGFFSKSGVDLDLGAFVRFKDGSAKLIQALGNSFGNLQQVPYVRLLEDDKTGASNSGEWLHINGDYWKNISEILVFAFIYDGVPDWTETDGVVTIHVPNELPVETRLTEGGKSNGMCAVARLINDNGTLNLQRVDRYFSGHKALDEAFGWGFRWKAGSK